MKSKPLYREFDIRKDDLNEEERTIKLSFSSEEPVERFFGQEILDHGDSSIRLSRLKNSAPLLVDHNTRDQIGIVKEVTIGNRRGESIVRFSKGQRATEILEDVKDEIRTKISVGYRVHKMVLESEEKDNSVYRVTDWEPFEISIVSIPADDTVGIGRSVDEIENEIQIIGERKMAEETPKVVEPQKPVDVQVIRAEARKDEMARIKDITLIGQKRGMDDLAKTFIDNGKSVDDFRTAVLDKMEEVGAIKPVDDDAANIGLTDKEARSFSFMRAINALANPSDRRAQEAAGFEFECSQAAAKRTGKDPQGIIVPLEVLQRDLTVGVAADGGDLVATNLMSGSFIDLLRNAMALNQFGVTTLTGLTGNIAIPRQTGGATAYWVAESGSPTESQQAFDQVPMSPETVGAFTDISRKLLLQSSIGIEQFVQGDLAKTLGLEIDRVGIHGSGAGNEPTGILNTTGIGDVVGGVNGLAPTWSHIVQLETAVANANADMGSIGYLTNTKVRGKLKETEKFSGTNGNPVYTDGDTPLNGYKTVISNQVPSNLDKGTSVGVASAIVFGNFSDLIIGMWGGLDLMVDPYTASTSGTVRVVALQDVDVAVRHAESFAAMQDALTA